MIGDRLDTEIDGQLKAMCHVKEFRSDGACICEWGLLQEVLAIKPEQVQKIWRMGEDGLESIWQLEPIART